MKTMKMKKAFSLVELLVVITIIAVLSVVAYTAVGGQTVKARDAKRKQDLNTIQQALELYFAETGRYPYNNNDPIFDYDTDGDANLATGKIWKKHLSKIPTDPSGNSYIYAVSGTASYELAAVLEMDGDPANYESYIVGNSDTHLATTSDGKYYNSGLTPPDLADCAVSLLISRGQITADTGGDAAYECVAYDPRP